MSLICQTYSAEIEEVEMDSEGKLEPVAAADRSRKSR